MGNKNRKNLELKLKHTVSPILATEDIKGKYISYCEFMHHRGIVGEARARKCKKIKCKHVT